MPALLTGLQRRRMEKRDSKQQRSGCDSLGARQVLSLAGISAPCTLLRFATVAAQDPNDKKPQCRGPCFQAPARVLQPEVKLQTLKP